MTKYVDDYKIVGEPPRRTVTAGAEVSYECRSTDKTGKIEAIDAPHDKCQWFCYNDRAMAEKLNVRRIVEGPKGFFWKDAKWDFVGRHTIKSVVTFTDGVKCYFDYPQWVDTLEAVIGSTFGRAKKEQIPHPHTQLSLITRYVKVLEDAGKRFPPQGRSEEEKHEERLKQLKIQRDKLKERLEGTDGKRNCAIPAVHLETTTQRRTVLRIRLVQMRDDWRDKKWRIVDWTNPAHKSLTGVYDGEGAHDEDAIRKAFEKWDSGNEYPPGHIRYKVPSWICPRLGTKYQQTFATDGKSFWTAISDFFGYVAMGAAVIAGIVTLVAPVPGARVVSGLIWTSIFSSTAAAAINIGQRYDRGFSNWKDDTFDVLSIVGNIFAAGQLGWMKGATVTLKSTRALKYTKYCLIGQFGTDGVQGILIAVDHLNQYDAIMNDKTLSPDDRVRKLMELFRSLVVAGALTGMSVKGTQKDLKNLKTNPKGTKNLKDLKNPGKEVEINEEVVIQGETRDKRMRARADDEQIRADSPARRAAAGEAQSFPKAQNAEARGMRPKDDAFFSQFAKKDDGRIIIVRNSNSVATEYIGKKGYKPKPMEMKAKTRKEGPNAGLAAADPTDSRFQEQMRVDGCSSPREWVDKKLGKDWTIGDAKDGYVIRDPAGNAFYSDYDLHGVYDAKTGKDVYTDQVKADWNKKMGEDLIQHGPQDQWPLRNDKGRAGPAYGPLPPCTAYMPDGSKVHLETIEDMKQFYKQHNIDWSGIWPNH